MIYLSGFVIIIPDKTTISVVSWHQMDTRLTRFVLDTRLVLETRLLFEIRLAEMEMGQWVVHGSWVKWVTIFGWVTWVMGQLCDGSHGSCWINSFYRATLCVARS